MDGPCGVMCRTDSASEGLVPLRRAVPLDIIRMGDGGRRGGVWSARTAAQAADDSWRRLAGTPCDRGWEAQIDDTVSPCPHRR